MGAKKKSASKDEKHIMVVAWYEPHEWRALQRYAVDAHVLDDTYEDWRRSTENLLANMQAIGQQAIKYPVEIDQLRAWCEEQELPLDGSARSRFVAEQAQMKYKQSHK